VSCNWVDNKYHNADGLIIGTVKYFNGEWEAKAACPPESGIGPLQFISLGTYVTETTAKRAAEQHFEQKKVEPSLIEQELSRLRSGLNHLDRRISAINSSFRPWDEVHQLIDDKIDFKVVGLSWRIRNAGFFGRLFGWWSDRSEK